MAERLSNLPVKELMISLLHYLCQFNAKERFFLVGHVLGNPQFTLDSAFRAELSKTMNLSLPGDLFCAMDFHLDWLYAALQLHADEGKIRIHSNTQGIIKAQQEDIDLIQVSRCTPDGKPSAQGLHWTVRNR